MYPGVWRHGDWIKITERGSAVIYGRSDSTINRGGVRMGTSEIYSAVEGVPEVLDTLVVDVDDRIVLFVVTSSELDEALADEIRRRVREHCSPRYVPDAIHRIDEVPRTLSNKKLEVPVKRILQGGDPDKAASRDSLANPAALDWFAERAARAQSAAEGSPRRRRADLGVEALDQLDAEGLGALEGRLVHPLRGVVEPVAAGDRDGGEAGGGGARRWRRG